MRYVPCPLCVSDFQHNFSEENQHIPEDERYHLFSLKELIREACLKDRKFIVCPNHTSDPILAASIAPDLFLTDLAVVHLTEDELVLDAVRIGEGSFGQVFPARYRGRPIAVKSLLRNSTGQETLPTGQQSSSMSSSTSSPSEVDKVGESDEPRDQTTLSTATTETSNTLQLVISSFPRLRYEVRMMSRLNHSCVLELIGVSVPRLAFAMELAPSGDLASYLHDLYKQRIEQFVLSEVVHEPILPRLLCLKIAFQVASVICYLHSMGVIHADIKTNNVLLFSTDICSPVNIKLTDYGISHDIDMTGTRGDVGHNAFCAPEVIRGLAFDEKVSFCMSYNSL